VLTIVELVGGALVTLATAGAASPVIAVGGVDVDVAAVLRATRFAAGASGRSSLFSCVNA